MATYKVPQDVEADDKLIGPFSFRQFIYLIIVALAGFLAWGLAQLFIGLVIIPLPIIVFFSMLALPLRKDQPMEIYMAAMLSFYLKPRKRMWDPEGIESLIEVAAPKTVEVQLTKGLSQSEAEQRLSYLASIVDTHGWAIRGVGSGGDTAVATDVYLEAQDAVDILDTNTLTARSFDHMMQESTERMHEEAVQRMQEATQPAALNPSPSPIPGEYAIPAPAVQPQQPQVQLQPLPPPQPQQPDPLLTQLSQQLGVSTGSAPAQGSISHVNPYPAIHQSTIEPLVQPPAVTSSQPRVEPKPAPAPIVAPPPKPTPPPTPKPKDIPAQTTSSSVPATGIMDIVDNNPDLNDESKEIVISLR